MELEYESKRPLYIPHAGPILLEFPLLNKGSAFTQDERASFNLHGLLPEAVETIEEQAARAYRQFQDFKTDIDKHIYLRNIQDTKPLQAALVLLNLAGGDCLKIRRAVLVEHHAPQISQLAATRATLEALGCSDFTQQTVVTA